MAPGAGFQLKTWGEGKRRLPLVGKTRVAGFGGRVGSEILHQPYLPLAVGRDADAGTVERCGEHIGVVGSGSIEHILDSRHAVPVTEVLADFCPAARRFAAQAGVPDENTGARQMCGPLLGNRAELRVNGERG
jgi:hypothetical protein